MPTEEPSEPLRHQQKQEGDIGRSGTTITVSTPPDIAYGRLFEYFESDSWMGHGEMQSASAAGTYVTGSVPYSRSLLNPGGRMGRATLLTLGLFVIGYIVSWWLLFLFVVIFGTLWLIVLGFSPPPAVKVSAAPLGEGRTLLKFEAFSGAPESYVVQARAWAETHLELV
jgi:hypothetical protein